MNFKVQKDNLNVCFHVNAAQRLKIEQMFYIHIHNVNNFKDIIYIIIYNLYTTMAICSFFSIYILQNGYKSNTFIYYYIQFLILKF